MKLSDLIIEHGPWTDGDAAALLTLRAAQGRAGRELNELREELVAARKASEERERFEVRAAASCEDAQLWLTCERHGLTSVIDEPLSLAELNRRAGEHAEVCR